jgi:hypothetical protein
LDSSNQNELGHKGNRYNMAWKKYWVWIFIMGGRKAYEAQRLNLKCIPSPRTISNAMDCVSERYQDGKSKIDRSK